jgi:Ca2+/Na+ antiporter
MTIASKEPKVSAIFTPSLPDYMTNKVAAENGFGNQTVSNAFGSNTFNIMIGLDPPWTLYIAATGFEPYHGLRNEGIVESIITLASWVCTSLILHLRLDKYTLETIQTFEE